ncbi:MAG: helix-turn-helix domain-containing protein [bacterium]
MKTNTPYKEALQKAGLNRNEADTYLYLLEHGKTPVQQLLKDTGLKRGNLYHILYSLRDQGLVIQSEEKKKLHFELNDPSTLRPLLDRQHQQIQENIREVEGILPELTSAYTLNYHKPGIVLFEGVDAERRILEDSLTATEDILQYVDLEAVTKQHSEMNRLFAKKRAQLKKKKRIILSDAPISREYALAQDSAITEVRLIDYPLPSFGTVMQMYGSKISYLTLNPSGMIGAIIEDPQIAQMHRSLFEAAWSQARPTPQKA